MGTSSSAPHAIPDPDDHYNEANPLMSNSTASRLNREAKLNNSISNSKRNDNEGGFLICLTNTWLGCNCLCCSPVPLGAGVLIWTGLTLAFDIFDFVTSDFSLFEGVIYLFEIICCDIPVIYFTMNNHATKLMFPFCAQCSAVVAMCCWAIYEFSLDDPRGGIESLIVDVILELLTSLALIPIFTLKLPLWNKADQSYAYLSKATIHSSAYNNGNNNVHEPDEML